MLWRGKVTRILPTGGVYVEIPRKAAGFQFGPLQIVEGIWTADQQVSTDTYTEVGSAPGPYDGATPHTHLMKADVLPLAPGDRVLVAELENDTDLLVVVGRLRG